MNKVRQSYMNTGIISFMVIFIILCMVTFSILSVSTAKANVESTDRSVSAKQDYYVLSSTVCAKVNEIDDVLTKAYKNASSSADYYSSITKDIKALSSTDAEVHYDDTNHRATVKAVKDSRAITAVLTINYSSGSPYTVESFTEAPSEQWQAEDTI